MGGQKSKPTMQQSVESYTGMSAHPAKKQPTAVSSSFAALSAEEQRLIREKQSRAKEEKKSKNQGSSASPVAAGSCGSQSQPVEHPTTISQGRYFSECPHHYFYDPSFVATEENLEALMKMVDENMVVGSGSRGDELRITGFQYFSFAGSSAQIWDPTFYARLAYEGFFTITTRRGRSGGVEPLPELQPFYGVVTWENFHKSKHVRKALRQLRQINLPLRSEDAQQGESNGPLFKYSLYSNKDVHATYKQLDAYQKKRHNGSNWMTENYFATMKKASADPNINFKLQSIELCTEPCDGGQPRVIAGEIGYTIGRVYTSLSGFYEVPGSGTLQLAALGRWLEHKNYSFWSLGHCYSPQMDYKRQLGHRIYPRTDFLQLNRTARGSFRCEDALEPRTDFSPLADCERCNLDFILEA